MSSGPIKRGHLIAPFGVGSMITVPNGTSMVAAGLDHWFEREDGEDSRDLDLDEFRVEEWRLERLLHVNHFREPPDFRFAERGQQIPNLKLTIPFLRFPQWHFCWRCNRLTELQLVTRGRQKCPHCHHEGKKSYLAQVPFVAMCERGHLQDFPWRQWVHRSAEPTCDMPVRLRSTGGATLSNQIVECDCGVSPRTLGRIVEADVDGSTYLTSALERGNPYTCQGISPQHGSTDPSPCGSPLRGSLRSASNVYFGRVVSAIYLPRTTETVPESLRSALEIPPLSTIVHLHREFKKDLEPQTLREAARQLLQPYTDAQVEEAIRFMGEGTVQSEAPQLSPDQTAEAVFRREEHEALQSERHEQQLSVSGEALNQYEAGLARYLSRVMLVERLRETRVLTGFNRIYPERPSMTSEERLEQVWRRVPEWRERWLPASKVFGEGIFIELDPTMVASWEARPEVAERAALVEDRYGSARDGRRLRPREVTARFLLLHTFAHLLINQLTFECGYSTAALRERLYVSSGEGEPMAGVLIYTADGDADGTMGGLVRMGRPGYLEPTVMAALEGALWCSADPVCMETGSQWGQGPDSCNLAACHNCALVPETACEEFNRFLDRGLVVGDLADRATGFFQVSA